MVADLNTIAQFLSRRDVATLSDIKVDVVALIGSSLIGSVRVAAEVYALEGTKTILVSGGIGHSTQDLRDNVRASEFSSVDTADRAEADIMGDLLVELGVPAKDIVIENQSTNCGANAVESRRVLDSLGLRPASLAIVQDPTMQLRTHLSFQRAWRGAEAPKFLSFAPFVPRAVEEPDGQLTLESDRDPIWRFDRFVSLLLGEIVRLRDDENGYGPRGKDFIDHVEIPSQVEEAYNRVSAQLNLQSRLATS